MQVDSLLVIISTLLSLMGIWYLLFWLYRDYRIDNFRQRMFSLRDQLFDEARKNEITFDDKAYGILRMTMNGFIRFGHKLSLLEVLLFLCLSRDEDFDQLGPSSFQNQWESAIGKAGVSQKAIYERYYRSMNMLAVEHAFLSSPMLVLAIFPVVVSFVVTQLCFDHAVKLFRSPLNGLDSAAMAYGEPC